MRVAHRVVGPLVLRWFRARVSGRDAIPGGPLILASNHVSYLDNYIVSAATPRPPCFLGKAELSKGLFGRLNHTMGMVPVQRGKGDWAAITTAVGLLAEGEIVALFPEGSRSPTGELYKFRSGLARIAAAAQVPVLPVGVLGTREVWPPGARLPWRRPAPGAVHVSYGTPLAPPADTPRGRRDFTAQVRGEVAAITGQPLAAAYAPVGEVATGSPEAATGLP